MTTRLVARAHGSTRTQPRSVNLSALPTRLRTTIVSLRGSVTSVHVGHVVAPVERDARRRAACCGAAVWPSARPEARAARTRLEVDLVAAGLDPADCERALDQLEQVAARA